METDFIEIFRVKTWLLLVAKSRLGLQVTKLLHVEPHQPRPPTACARPRLNIVSGHRVLSHALAPHLTHVDTGEKLDPEIDKTSDTH